MYAIILVGLFVVLMIGIGLWGMKKTSSLNDFFLGGRNIGPWISAFAYGTTYFSAVLFIGFAGKIGWLFGMNSLWIAVGNTLFGALLSWLVLGRRTRIMSRNLDVMTMPEFLQERYQGNNLKIISALIIFIFLVPYSASVFKGLGHLFEINFNISFNTALLIMISITGIYLILGGYFAIAMTDFIQGLIMIVGSIMMIVVLVGKGGGVSASIGTIMAKYPVHIPADKHPGYLLLGSLFFLTSFGTWGLPQMVQKFYAIKDESVIKKAAVVTALFAMIISFAAYFTGSLTHLFYDKLPTLSSGAPDFDRLIPELLKNNLPEFLMAVILLLVLSASMSTLSSLVLISASTVAIDLYKGHINPQISKERSVTMMRVLSGIFIVVSYIVARYEFEIIITLMSLSWGVVAGSFMAPYMLGLFWRKTTLAGVLAGMTTGFSLAIGLFFILGPKYSPIASSIAMIAPFPVTFLVSLFTSPPSQKVIERAFREI